MPSDARMMKKTTGDSAPAVRRFGRTAPDVETEIQEDLTGEIDALAAAIFDLLKRRRDLEDAAITEDMVQRLREVLFFAAMNGAIDMLDMAGEARRP
jgi:hypothetical protein